MLDTITGFDASGLTGGSGFDLLGHASEMHS